MRNLVSRSFRSVSSMKGVASAVALVVVASCGAGCKRLLKKRGDAGAAASTSAATNAQDDADEQLQEKIDEYINCLNTLSSSINQSRHRYLTYIPKNGPTGRETYADIYRIPNGATASCAAGAAKAKVMPPPDPKLDAVGAEFAAAASEVERLITEIDPYFENKDFRDDKWRKGKSLHPKLMAGWTRFSKADKELHDTLDGITKPLAQRLLARIEKEEGRKYRYFRKNLLITSRELVEASDPVGEDEDIDFSLYSAAYTAFEKALDDLQGYGTTHKPELSDPKRAPTWQMAESNYDAFVKEATDFKRSSKELWRCLRDAPAKAKMPSGKIDMDKMGNCADGPAWKQADDVIKQYNEFIRTSNTHQFP